jgi:hypothetical protein
VTAGKNKNANFFFSINILSLLNKKIFFWVTDIYPIRTELKGKIYWKPKHAFVSYCCKDIANKKIISSIIFLWLDAKRANVSILLF